MKNVYIWEQRIKHAFRTHIKEGRRVEVVLGSTEDVFKAVQVLLHVLDLRIQLIPVEYIISHY